MPELPEVETTVRGLRETIVGLTIKSVWNNTWSLAQVARETHKNKSYFKKLLEQVMGRKIVSVKRRAKHIVIHLSGDVTLIIHMKMTGHLLYGKYVSTNERSNEWPWKPDPFIGHLADPYNRHIRTVVTLSNGKHLVFCDSRKFGTIRVFTSKEADAYLETLLGPEPLSSSFSFEIFERLIKKSKRPIKQVLMDQSVIAGIGNIYSDEMLHRASVSPFRSASSLSGKEVKAIYVAMKEVLQKGIKLKGDSTSDYRNVDGARGSFHGNHLVYLRRAMPCLRATCKGTIMRRVIGGRSAHYCSKCQA